jgi:hypothetical protein
MDYHNRRKAYRSTTSDGTLRTWAGRLVSATDGRAILLLSPRDASNEDEYPDRQPTLAGAASASLPTSGSQYLCDSM